MSWTLCIYLFCICKIKLTKFDGISCVLTILCDCSCFPVELRTMKVNGWWEFRERDREELKRFEDTGIVTGTEKRTEKEIMGKTICTRDGKGK